MTSGPGRYLQLPQHLEQILVVRLIGNVVNVFKGNLAFFVDDENCPFANTIALPVSPEFPSHVPFGFEIAQEIVGKSTKALGPCCITRHAINGNAQNLSIIAFKAIEVGLVRRHLRGSNRRPGQRVKRQHHVVLATEV